MSYQPPTDYNQQNPDWQDGSGQPGYSQSGYSQQSYSQPYDAPPPGPPSPYASPPQPLPNSPYDPYAVPVYPSYSVPTPSYERGRGVALAGFIIGIICLVALVGLFLPNTLLVGFTVLAEIPLSILGIFLSAFGCRSRSRRVIAIVGLVLSIVVLVLLVLLLLLGIYITTHP